MMPITNGTVAISPIQYQLRPVIVAAGGIAAFILSRLANWKL